MLTGVTGLVPSHPAEASNRGHLQRRIHQHHSWTSLSLALNSNEDTAGSSSSTTSRRAFFQTSFLTCTAVATNPGSSAAATEMPSIPQTTISSGLPTASSFQESISGFVAGAALATTKTLVKFPLDTATVRLQVPTGDEKTIKEQELSRLFRGSYDGVTLSLLSNIPGGAIFFAVKDAVKASLRESTLPLPKYVSTTIAVGAACIPYWIVRNPSEVIKVRQQAATNGYGNGMSAAQAIDLARKEAKDSGSLLETFYSGYWANIAYGFPADIIKFLAYEMLTDGRRDLSPAEAATTGALATAIAQLVTTPLDVVRNRLMTSQAPTKNDKEASSSDDSDIKNEESYWDKLSTLAREEGIDGLFAGVTPRIGKALLSGAIQFATYEETKQSISRLMLKPPQ